MDYGFDAKATLTETDLQGVGVASGPYSNSLGHSYADDDQTSWPFDLEASVSGGDSYTYYGPAGFSMDSEADAKATAILETPETDSDAAGDTCHPPIDDNVPLPEGDLLELIRKCVDSIGTGDDCLQQR